MTSKITLFRIEDFMRINKAFVLSCFLIAGTAGYSQLSKKSGSGATASTNVTLQAFNGKSKTSKLSNHETPLTLMKGKVEDVSKRDAYSKHFKNGNGTFTAVIANGPIHYSKNGKFEDISTQITAGNNAQFPYANKSNLMESHFGATAANGILSSSAEGSIREFVNNKMYWEVNGQPASLRNGADVAVSINENKATYANLFQGIDAEFTVLAGNRKLNYVLNNRAAIAQVPAGADYLVFSEDVILQPTWTQTATSRGIRIADGNGKIVYNYENPTSQDAAGMTPFTENTVSSFSRNGNILTVLTKVKTSWLLNSARVFPILVDPTSVYYPNNTTNSSGQCTSAAGASGDIYAGYYDNLFRRGWVTFNTSGLPACTVSSATLSLYAGAVVGNFSTTNAIMVGQSKYDLSSADFFASYGDIYTAITDNPTNTGGAYAQITNATQGSYLNVDLGTYGSADIAAKAGGANSFFPLSFSASWPTGSANTVMAFYGYADTTRRPYLTVVYTQTENYCHPSNVMANCAGYGDCNYIGISNVQTGTINNTTTYNNTPTGYNAYPALQTEVQKGQPYTVSVTYKDGGLPNTNPGNIGLWIDWNQDGNAIGSEFIGNSGILTNNQTYTFNFTVPQNAAPGLARLRVRSAFTAERTLIAADFCRSLDYGETEDYNLTVVSPPVNDDCENATPLTVGENFAAHAVTGTTLNATNSPVSAPECGDYTGSDVWYTITAPANGEVTIETGAAAGSNVTDTGIAVYSGNECFSAVQIGCNDNNNTNNFSSLQLTGLAANEVLHIRVWSNGNAVNGEFQVSAWSAALSVNDANASVVGLYPNPAQTKLTIKTAENIQSVAVYSVLGQLVKTVASSNKTVDVSNLSNGTYLLRVTLENGKVISEKFIKN